MKRTLMMTAAFALLAQMAAALTADELAASLTSQGYGYIQIKSGTTQIKVEAVKDGQKVETIYDAATGSVLKSETYAIGTIGSVDPGVRLRDVPRDFVRVNQDGTLSSGRDRGDDQFGGPGRGRDDLALAGAPDRRGERSSDDHPEDHSDTHTEDHSEDHSDDHGGDHGDDHGGDRGGDRGGRGRD